MNNSKALSISKEYWKQYWLNHSPGKLNKAFFDEYLKLIPEHSDLIEIGGFPGVFAGYLNKKCNIKVTILDYIIIPEVINEVEKLYGLKKGELHIINKDFLEFRSTNLYDVVSSFGFIEHFQNTADILEKHISLLKSNGLLFVTIPNFRGLNGLVQWLFDKPNYYRHNISSMKVSNLKSIITKFNLKDYKVQYIGRPRIWIEESNSEKRKIELFIKLFNIILRIFPFSKNRILAPHIIIIGIK